jgi:spermidine/putrescine-binding protein
MGQSSGNSPSIPAGSATTGGAMTRRRLLGVTATGIFGLYAAGCGSGAGAAGGGGTGGSTTTLSWLTWDDHYLTNQLSAIAKTQGIRAQPQLFADNSDAYLKIKQTNGQFDIVSGDAMWVPKYRKDGLTKSFDINGLKAASQLYPIARQFPFWRDGSNYDAFPVGWSSQQLYYNPKYVTTAPDSWHALAEPKYKGHIVMLNSPSDMMAIGGLATGARHPYDMTAAEIASAKQYLASIKPNILKLASQSGELVNALVDGSAWISLNNLGADLLVKQAGGPTVKAVTPKEGTVGFIDGEQPVAASSNIDKVLQFLGAAEVSTYIAQNFLKNGRPLFNEQAYKILVNQGHKDRADLYHYNEPEKALQMTLKGPSGNAQAYTDAFNEVFGA